MEEELERKLGKAPETPPSAPSPQSAPEEPDENSPPLVFDDAEDIRPCQDPEDDHSFTDIDLDAEITRQLADDTPPELKALNSEHVHPGLAAALSASFNYEVNGLPDDPAEDEDTSGADDAKAAPRNVEGLGVDDDSRAPLEPEDSGDDDGPDAAPDKDEEGESDAENETEDDDIAGEEEEEEDRPMTFADHFRELRKRLFRAFLLLLLGFFCCYPFAEQLFGLLTQPLLVTMPKNSTFIFTSPPEAFFTYMKVALVAGFFAVSPLIFYQVWAFVAPGLYKEEKLYILPIAFFSALFFIGGGAFCYYIVFPFAFEFFMSYNTGIIQAMPALSETLSFVLKLLLAFGLVFEMPLFAFFLSRMGLVTADMMRKFRRYAVLALVILAAILTPPDVLSQLLMAGPLLVLYEASILIAAIFGKKKPGTDDDDDEEDDDEDEGEDEEVRLPAQ
ncbi:twin-arginine translocase subunit TatC [Desulfovibrio sp. OttesenSCG-928-M14]|nr:twin-arginine translocase subunit TatC [Desulfovibrio sp. OttesenSCG-928-M14]